MTPSLSIFILVPIAIILLLAFIYLGVRFGTSAYFASKRQYEKYLYGREVAKKNKTA